MLNMSVSWWIARDILLVWLQESMSRLRLETVGRNHPHQTTTTTTTTTSRTCVCSSADKKGSTHNLSVRRNGWLTGCVKRNCSQYGRNSPIGQTKKVKNVTKQSSADVRETLSRFPSESVVRPRPNWLHYGTDKNVGPARAFLRCVVIFWQPRVLVGTTTRTRN